MKENVENQIDFSQCNYTFVVSDLHLCEAETPPVNNPIYKRYKQKDVFFDDEFSLFLNYIQKESDSDPAEIILNGDIFDFDSMTRIPDHPKYKVSWLEKKRGLDPEEDKSVYKITEIIKDHPTWFGSLSKFIKDGNRAIFVIGNHDLELHFKGVQAAIVNSLDLNDEEKERVRFCAWFYISNKDTLIEHGNQYDPYCLCHNPINPLIEKANKVEVRVPFGNLAGRYMINGMGYFNPHDDSNFIMTLSEYWKFFTKYLIRTEKLIMWTWFWGALVTLIQSFWDRLLPDLKDPLTIEDRIQDIADNSNATPRMVRELKELAVHPAASNPFLMARELWLDRAFLVIIGFYGAFHLFSLVNVFYEISLFWMFIPLSIFIPFFVFYAKSIRSSVSVYKKPNERILSLTSQITGVKRVIYGHTHIYTHEFMGEIEHLNSGTWSPIFEDVECTIPMGRKTFVYIKKGDSDERSSQLLEFKQGKIIPVYKSDGKEKNLAS